MRRPALAVVLALACLQCGPKVRMLPRDAPVPWDKSGIDWSKPPALGAPLGFTPPSAQTFELSNGLRVIIVENHSVRLVSVALVHEAAGSREDGDKPGLAALTSTLLASAAGKYDRKDLQQALEVAGARFETHIATDYAAMELVVPTAQLEAALGVVAEMVMAPRFETQQATAMRDERVAEIEARRERARTIAAQVFDRVVFGAHPYAVPADGNPKVVAALKAGDVRAFWARAYRPDRATLIVAGDLSPDGLHGARELVNRIPDAQRLCEKLFGSWRAQPTTTTTPSAPPLPRYAPQLALVDMPGARQSVVLIGRRAGASTETRLADDLANAIVGGGIGARLDKTLHEQLGLSLGASASYWRGQWAGSWALATTFATDKTLEGIRAALRVVDGVRTDVTADEVAHAKADLLSAAQQQFDTTASTARAFERLVAQGLPLDWYATYQQRLEAITLADVRAASAWQDLSIVVVGDRAKLETPLGELGLPIVHYDRDGTKP